MNIVRCKAVEVTADEVVATVWTKEYELPRVGFAKTDDDWVKVGDEFYFYLNDEVQPYVTALCGACRRTGYARGLAAGFAIATIPALMLTLSFLLLKR